MIDEKFLRSLPPEIQAKIRAEQSDADYQRAHEKFLELITMASDAILSNAVVAWDETKDAEKEDAVRAATLALAMVQGIGQIVVNVIPPKPRREIMNLVLATVGRNLPRYDTTIRTNLPKMSEIRARGGDLTIVAEEPK